MNTLFKRFTSWICFSLLLVAGTAFAQEYPSKPVRIVVGFPPGSSADLMGRIMADQLARQLGGQVVVVNTVGASGTLAAGAVAKASPDGHTLLVTTTVLNLSPHLYKSVPYEPFKSFTAIARVANTPFCIVVQSQSPLQSVRDIIAEAKAKPGSLNYGTGGSASTGWFAGALMNQLAKVDIQNVAYTGLPAALTALIGGQVQMVFSDLPSTIGHVRSGRLRMVAVTSAQRMDMMPEVPTIAESGLPGYAVVNWYGVFAPSGLPGPLLARLQGAIAAIFKSPEKALLDQFANLALIPPPLNTPEQFVEYLRADFEFWKKLVADTGVKPN